MDAVANRLAVSNDQHLDEICKAAMVADRGFPGGSVRLY